jgi:hypothetical protein
MYSFLTQLYLLYVYVLIQFLFIGTHSGKKFAELFYDVLDSYSVVDCLHTITADNASVNLKMARELDLQIPHFSSSTDILGCVAHVINLAAKVGIAALGPIDQNQDGEEILMAKNDNVASNRMNINSLVSTPDGVDINAQTINK